MKKLTWKKQICEVKILDTNGVEMQSESTTTADNDGGGHHQRLRNTDVSFERAMWPIIAAVQICGILPVTGIRRSRYTPHATVFKWRAVRVIYSLVFMLLVSVIIYMYVVRLKQAGITAKRFAGVVVLMISLASCILFFRLAHKWRPLMSRWNRTEAIFLRYPYETGRFRLSTKIRTVAGVWLFLALFEHVVYLVQRIIVQQDQIERCKWQIDDRLRHFLVAEHNYIFETVPYSLWLGMLISWVNVISVIGWSCADIFIMIVAIGLMHRFQQINRRLNTLAAQSIDEITWMEIRLHYVSACELLDTVDDHLGLLILLSCINNMCFICFQLLNTFEKLPYFVNYVYFWFSLLFLISRTVSVFLSASGIHDASKEPANVLRTVRTVDWSVEAERMLDQVNNDEIALSGKQFFYLTRKVLLAMIGTIVTYELVLLQFDKSEPRPSVGTATFCRALSRTT